MLNTQVKVYSCQHRQSFLMPEMQIIPADKNIYQQKAYDSAADKNDPGAFFTVEKFFE